MLLKRINFLLDLSKTKLDSSINFLIKNQAEGKHYKDKEAVFVYQSQIDQKIYHIEHINSKKTCIYHLTDFPIHRNFKNQFIVGKIINE